MCSKKSTYHRLLGKRLDLLDGTRSSLLEGDAVDLYSIKNWYQSSVQCPRGPFMDFIKLNVHVCGGEWCIRERQHQRWRCGPCPQASFLTWRTFLITVSQSCKILAVGDGCLLSCCERLVVGCGRKCACVFEIPTRVNFWVVSGGCGQMFRRAWQATARICEFTLPPSSRYCQCLHLYNQPLQQSHKPVSSWSNTNTHTTVPYYNNLLFVSETDVSLLL